MSGSWCLNVSGSWYLNTGLLPPHDGGGPHPGHRAVPPSRGVALLPRPGPGGPRGGGAVARQGVLGVGALPHAMEGARDSEGGGLEESHACMNKSVGLRQLTFGQNLDLF